ncbi:MAG: hypothetical protein H6835_18245 [Planctomycetes bacterium]|nr:hypothetical protein [Planctomycetota bacterium]
MDLPLQVVVRQLVASADTRETDWVVQGTVTPWRNETSARLLLQWRQREGRSRADDILAAIDADGRFSFTAPTRAWQPFGSYPFRIEIEETIAEQGWCVLDHLLELRASHHQTLAGRIQEPDGSFAVFDFVVYSRLPTGALHHAGGGSTSADGSFTTPASCPAPLQDLVINARSQSSQRLFTFRPDLSTLLDGSAILRGSETVCRLRAMKAETADSQGVNVLAAFLDAAGKRLPLSARRSNTEDLFVIHCPTDGTLLLLASADGHEPSASTITLRGDQAIAELPPIVLQPLGLPANLRGRVTFADGSPCIGTSVLMTPSGWDLEIALDNTQQVLVDATGSFEFAATEGASYRLIAQHPSHAGFWQEADPVTSKSPVLLQMPRIGKVQVQPLAAGALGAVGWPIPFHYLATSVAAGGPVSAGTLYSLDRSLPLPTGVHRLHLATADLGTFGQAIVTVSEGDTVPVTVHMIPTTVVSGRVLDEAASPVHGAQVQLTTPGVHAQCAERWFQGRSGPDGSFHLIVPSQDVLQLQVAVAGRRWLAEVTDPRALVTLTPPK